MKGGIFPVGSETGSNQCENLGVIEYGAIGVIIYAFNIVFLLLLPVRADIHRRDHELLIMERTHVSRVLETILFFSGRRQKENGRRKEDTHRKNDI